MVLRTNTTRARQGSSGKPILWVLGISTILAAAVLFGSWAMHSDELAQGNQKSVVQPAAERNFAETEPTPRQNETTPPPVR